jgi:UDP-N-acetylmuramyl pentapeptide phosphotransferase/UDP-N-acetylglucosamine-1-phosphate transferase
VWPIASAAAVGFAILFVPLFDTLRVFSYRIIHGIPPFTPDRNHIHHILMRFGWSHLKISLVLGAVSVLCIAAAIQVQHLGTPIVMISMLTTAFLAVGGLIWQYHLQVKRQMKENFPRIGSKEKEAPVVPVSSKKAANQ